MSKLDPTAIPRRHDLLESFNDWKHGWLDYEPISKIIQKPGKPIAWPISLPDNLIGTDQPNVPTCTLPSPTNLGCPKASKCPIAHMRLTHLGPGMVLMRNRDAVSAIECFNYFGADDERGKPIYQINWSEQGWKMDTSITTQPVLGTTEFTGPDGRKHMRREVWQKDVPDLLPYWWPLLKKQGKKLPKAAERFPQFVDDEEEPSTQISGSPESSPSASPVGRKRRRKARRRKATVSSKSRSAPPSSDSPAPDA